jgi:peptide/nickel transport system permease protein
MIAYIVRRVLWLPVLLVVISMLTWALGVYGPGDPCQVRLGQHNDPESVARCHQQLGLDRPFLVQYTDYVGKVLHGDLGDSYKYNRPVSDLLAKRLAVSIQLNAVVLVLGVLIGVPLGILSALRRNSWSDHLIVAGVVAGISVPELVLAPILQWLFAFKLRWLPTGGWGGLLDTHIILPAMILATGPIAVFVRQTRASMLQVLGQDYLRTARSKGLGERAVIVVHALRNALIPLYTIFGLLVGGLVGGTLIIETIFGIPGLGQLGFEALFARDYPVIMALTLLAAGSFVVANLLIDVGYVFLDPRIRYQGKTE